MTVLHTRHNLVVSPWQDPVLPGGISNTFPD
jgi:hypothetical protein